MDGKLSSKRAAANAPGMPAAIGAQREGPRGFRVEDRRPVSQLQAKVQSLTDASGRLSRFRWTGVPQSMMGFQPITHHANTLGGDMHNLSGKVASHARLGGVVVVHEDGREYRPTLEAFNSRVESERAMDEYYREKDQEDEDLTDHILFLMEKHHSTEIVSRMTGVSELEIEDIVAGAKSSEEDDTLNMDM